MKTQRKIASDPHQIPKLLVVTNNFPVRWSWVHKFKHANKIQIKKRNNNQITLFETEIMVMNYTKLIDITAFRRMSFIRNRIV